MSDVTNPPSPDVTDMGAPNSRRSTWITVGVIAAVTLVLVFFGGGQARFGRDHMAEDPSSTWDWAFFWDLVPDFGRALWITVQATVMGFALAVVLGLFLALARRSERRWLRWPTATAIEFIRSTPLLIQLYFLYFALPSFDIVLDPLPALVLGLGVHYATYCSEGYRAGINSVPKGQWEAATALNLGPVAKWTKVILPQAIPNVLPALGNFGIASFKEAPLGATIQVTGIVFFADTIQSRTFRSVEIWTLVGIGFLAVSIPAAFLLRRLERSLGYQRT